MPYKPVHETATDNRNGEEKARGGAVLSESLHRSGMDARSLPADAREWRPGIDGVVAAEYEVNLEANLQCLLGRIHTGSYKAPPVRRAYIPKADGSERPLDSRPSRSRLPHSHRRS